MSIYYSPELVRALMQDRILDARNALALSQLREDDRVLRTESRLSRLARLLPRRSTSQAAPCQPC